MFYRVVSERCFASMILYDRAGERDFELGSRMGATAWREDPLWCREEVHSVISKQEKIAQAKMIVVEQKLKILKIRITTRNVLKSRKSGHGKSPCTGVRPFTSTYMAVE